MPARPTWVRKVFVTLVLLAGLGVVMVGYFYSQITAGIEVEARDEPNLLDAKEADRKLKVYRDALKGSRRGFIRLSEVELNSYLQKEYFDEPEAAETNSPPPRTQLWKSQVGLFNQDITWSCWVRKNVGGKRMDLVWQRGVEIKGGPERWSFDTKSMRIGRMEVPPRFWAFVEKQLGDADLVFSNEFAWLIRLPTLEIKTNEMTSSHELRLYTYPVGATLGRTNP